MKSKKTTKVKKNAKSEDLDLLSSLPDDPPVSDVGSGSGSDHEEDNDDDGEHGNFLQQLAKLEGETRFLHHRDEINLDAPVGELLGQQVSLDDLLDEGDKKKKVKKELTKSLKGVHSLPAPLTTPQQERAERSALYERVKEEVRSWDPVVHARRSAQQVTYPLQKADMKLVTAKQSSAAFKPKTPLELEVAQLLQGSKAIVKSGQELSQEEESALAQMTLQEAREKRKELAKLKVLQSYQEAKQKRQNKIKSKKYRKIMRKEREREKLRELEELQLTNPELAAERIASEEAVRIGERASLKHRNSSKYLQQQAQRARKNNDKESQRAISSQIQRHRDLTTKIDRNGENEEEATAEENYDDEIVGDESNPWIGKAAKSIEETPDEFAKNVGEFLTKEKAKKKKKPKEASSVEIRQRLEMADNIDDLFNEGGMIMQDKARKKLKKVEGNEDSDEELSEQQSEEEEEKIEDINLSAKPAQLRPKANPSKPSSAAAVLDPDSFVKPTKITGSANFEMNEAEEASDEDKSDGDDDDQGAAIAEAFADDDIGNEFQSEKEALKKARQAKKIDLTLPGWGDWGGHGIKVSNRKRKRFTIRAGPTPKRRDDNKGNLILNDAQASAKIKSHQVSSVPFPYTSVADFEASIRAPVGETFVPRTAFKKLTAPRVVTKKGAVIEAMDKSELVKRNLV